MRQEDLLAVARLLTTYWQGQQPDDLAMYSACYQLAALVLDSVSRVVAEHIQQAPAAHDEIIIATLNQLAEREPAVRALAESLLGVGSSPSRATLSPHPNISIHGSNNQISVGPHLGPVTQIMNQPSGDQRQRAIAQGVGGGGVTTPTQDDIARQQQLLDTHRATLVHYLRQRAQLGTAHESPGIAHGIAEARTGIAHCKAVLHGWGIDVMDHPDDEETQQL